MFRAIFWFVSWLAIASPALALEVQVKEVRAESPAVNATIEMRDVLPGRLKALLDNGGVLHLRVETELWQSQPVWDRLVYPAIVRVFRFARGTGERDIAVTDPGGAVSTYANVPNPLPIKVEIGNADRLTATDRYYVRVVATLGTLAEREIDDVGDAVFGREADANSLGSLGRLVLRGVLKVSDYFESVTARTTSRKLSGGEILGRSRP